MGDFEELLTELSKAGIRYLVVGGVAVVLHGYGRSTGDLDIVVDFEPANLDRALRLFEERGFKPRPPVPSRAFGDAAERQRWIEEKNLQVFSLWHPGKPLFTLDIFIEEPFPFEEAYQRATRAFVGDYVIPVASIDDVIAMKRRAGRPQDVIDIEVLLDLKNGRTDDRLRDAPFDGSFEGTRRRQALLGVDVPAAEQLRWFERHMAELRRLVGRAS